jgi:hypothetical protein
VLQALISHKKWLESLKSEIEVKKKMSMQEMLEEEMRRVRIKENAKKVCQLVKTEQADQIAQKVYPSFEPFNPSRDHTGPAEQSKSVSRALPPREALEPLKRQSRSPEHLAATRNPEPQTKQDAPKAADLKKKEKPAWIKTEAQQEDEEVDDLLNFMDNFDANQYAQDVQIREMLSTLKKRVGEMKEEENWKENWEKRMKEKKKKREEEYLKEKAAKAVDDDLVAVNGDNASQLGVGGGSIGSRGEAKTVLSERTQGTSGSPRVHKISQGEVGEPKPREERMGQIGKLG